MKIIEQYHEILSITPDDPLLAIEAAGRTCYKSEDNIGCTVSGKLKEFPNNKYIPCQYYIANTCHNPECQHHSSYGFIRMLLSRGHHAMIEFGDITVRFVTNRGVTHELVRHRLFSFAQESTRYVRLRDDIEFIRPVWWDESTKEQKADWTKHAVLSEARYKSLLQHGWRPEQARDVLPNALKTEIVVKGNIREWRHALTLRTSPQAHPQIRALMAGLLTELKARVPVVFENLDGRETNETSIIRIKHKRRDV